MPAPEIAALATTPVAPPSSLDQELLLLETLKSLLDGAIRSLSGGDAQSLLEMSRQITSTAQQLLTFCLQQGQLSATAEAQERRRKLLAEMAQQRAFCRAMLRRWRRSIALRRQLLALRSEPVPYTATLTGGLR
jgi:hypothetical protein